MAHTTGRLTHFVLRLRCVHAVEVLLQMKLLYHAALSRCWTVGGPAVPNVGRVSPIRPDRGALPHDGGSAEVADSCGLGAQRWKVAHYGHGRQTVHLLSRSGHGAPDG